MSHDTRVLFFTPGCFDKGGVSRYSRYEIAALTELFGAKNVRVMSVLGSDEHSLEEPIQVHWAGRQAGTIHKSRRDKAAFVAEAVHSAVLWRPDVVHAAHINLGMLAAVLARLSRARSVLNIYGWEAWSPQRPDVRWGLKASDWVLSDCHATASYVEEQGIRPRGSIPVLWDCVDLNRFTPAEPDPVAMRRYGIPDPAVHPIVMTLGRLAKVAAYKGYERLVQVFARLSAKYPNARLVMAGSGGDLVEPLKQLAVQLGIADQVIFTGPVAEDDLVDIYRCATVFSLVTEAGPMSGEGLPLTPLEAMACGAPALVGNQDGSREAVEDGTNGYILDPHDLDHHADALGRILGDHRLRERLSDGAVRFVGENFSYLAFVRKHDELYRRMLGRR